MSDYRGIGSQYGNQYPMSDYRVIGFVQRTGSGSVPHLFMLGRWSSVIVSTSIYRNDVPLFFPLTLKLEGVVQCTSSYNLLGTNSLRRIETSFTPLLLETQHFRLN